VIGSLESPSLARRQFLELPDQAKDLVERALVQAGLEKSDVRFWACHQGTPWIGKLTQEHLGLDHAIRVDTFKWAGSLSGANLPLVLSVGEREGVLRRGDVVALFTGGSGMTGTGMVLRW
jgi:3-oxoacyl-[acyl-carrier-protein] synthase-3